MLLLFSYRRRRDLGDSAVLLSSRAGVSSLYPVRKHVNTRADFYTFVARVLFERATVETAFSTFDSDAPEESYLFVRVKRRRDAATERRRP